jgi:hypothetical protein
MRDRAELLRLLAEFREPPEPLLKQLRTFPWDWHADDPLLVLTRDHFRQVFDRFIAGELTAAQLQDWAECLEQRDDVAFDPSHEELLDELHFRVANPKINGELTVELVNEMRSELGDV